jgi:hypothetical protein
VATVIEKRPTGSGKIGRRRLLAAATAAGVCGAGAIAAPHLIPLAEQKLQQVALAELRSVEGVSLDAAIEAADVTRAGVKVIVVPVARLVSFLGSGALTLVEAALAGAHNALSFFHLSTTAVDALQTMVASWQTGLGSLPIALSDYADADINSAEAYLKALRKMVS